MAKDSKKPSGLKIARKGDKLICSWKKGENNYKDGQQFQYNINNKTTTTGKGKNKKTVTDWDPTTKNKKANIAVGKSSKKITISLSKYFPSTSRKLTHFQFRVRGNKQKEKNDKVELGWSDWAKKGVDIKPPKKPSLSTELLNNNATKFTWSTADAGDEAFTWFKEVSFETLGSTNKNITGYGSVAKSNSWHRETGPGMKNASGNKTYTEQSESTEWRYVRFVRVKARGPAGDSEYQVKYHVYGKPNEASLNYRRGWFINGSRGVSVEVRWTTSTSFMFPVDKSNVEYHIGTPGPNLSVPVGASPTAVPGDFNDPAEGKAIFEVDNVPGEDQLMWVRVNNTHDNDVNYGTWYSVLDAKNNLIRGKLAAPEINDVDVASTVSKRVTITATNNSNVPGSVLVVTYKDTGNTKGFDIGVIRAGESSVTVQCPTNVDWSTKRIWFSVRAVYATVTVSSQTSDYISKTVKVTNLKMESDSVESGGVVPRAPASVAVNPTDTPGTVRVTWDWNWDEADGAELSWANHEDAWESTDAPSTFELTKINTPAWNISGLEVGQVWWVRVRTTAGSGDDLVYSAYSEPVRVNLTSAPATPYLALSEETIEETGSVIASWGYASNDGTAQSYAEVAEVITTIVNEEEQTEYVTVASTDTAQHVTISNEIQNADGTTSYRWSAGDTVRLACRVQSASGNFSDNWSNPVQLRIAEPLVAAFVQSENSPLEELTVVEDDVSRTGLFLTALPLTITVTGAGEEGTTSLYIERTEPYHVDRPDETEFEGFDEETIYSYTQTGELPFEITPESLDGSLDDGAKYQLVGVIQNSIGQWDDIKLPFEVLWEHQAIPPVTENDEDVWMPTVEIDQEETVATLTLPQAPTGWMAGDTCDIYRLSVDRPELVVKGGEFGSVYIDPYPTIGEFGGYRFVYMTSNGDYIAPGDRFAMIDIMASLDTLSNIIDFGGNQVIITYNVDLSNQWKKDFKETQYLGGSVQGDWNPAVSRTGSINGVLIKATDQELIEAMRRLAVYPEVCHVRTVDGSSYSADVQVSESRGHEPSDLVASFTLNITRVDPEEPDGVPISEYYPEDEEPEGEEFVEEELVDE